MIRRIFSLCLGLFVLCCGAAAQAGHGHGGWHVDFFYGGGWPGPYYRPWPYYNYVYVAPPPVVYAPPAVVTVPTLTSVPQQTTAPTASTTPTSTSIATPLVRANSNSAPRSTGVTIRNPVASGTTIAFVVDSRTEAELAPGETMPLVEKNSYFVEFDRGGNYGTSKRTLGEGTYEFVATDAGWDLRRADDLDPVPTPVVKRNALPTTK